jgi:hypothetical protein
MNLFFINNNTTLFCSILAIEHLGLDWAKSVAGLSRGTNGEWLPFNKTYNLETKTGFKEFQSLIKNQATAFKVFAPHDGSSKGLRQRAIKSAFCEKVYYLEEGLLSYKTHPFRLSSDAKKLCRLPLLGKRFEKLLEKPFFSAYNPYFIALSRDAFPFADRDSIIAVEKPEKFLRYYAPRISQPAFIMLATPAEPFEPILHAYKQISDSKETRDVYLKLHPDAHKERYREMTKKITSNAKRIGARLLDAGTVIEAEVLLHGHHLIGNPTTSLAFYAEMLGGEYTAVNPWADVNLTSQI